jgi:hypothetical protein
VTQETYDKDMANASYSSDEKKQTNGQLLYDIAVASEKVSTGELNIVEQLKRHNRSALLRVAEEGTSQIWERDCFMEYTLTMFEFLYQTGNEQFISREDYNHLVRIMQIADAKAKSLLSGNAATGPHKIISAFVCSQTGERPV